MYSPTPSLTLVLRWGWVVSNMARPLYHWDRPGTICIGGWEALGQVCMCVENLTPTGIRSPDSPSHSN